MALKHGHEIVLFNSKLNIKICVFTGSDDYQNFYRDNPDWVLDQDFGDDRTSLLQALSKVNEYNIFVAKNVPPIISLDVAALHSSVVEDIARHCMDTYEEGHFDELLKKARNGEDWDNWAD